MRTRLRKGGGGGGGVFPLDNIFIERLWRNLIYEALNLHALET